MKLVHRTTRRIRKHMATLALTLALVVAATFRLVVILQGVHRTELLRPQLIHPELLYWAIMWSH